MKFGKISMIKSAAERVARKATEVMIVSAAHNWEIEDTRELKILRRALREFDAWVECAGMHQKGCKR